MSTYIAQTKGDRIQFPPAIADQVRNSGWLEVLVVPSDDNESLTVYPLPHPGAPSGGFKTEVDAKDGLHISDEICSQVNLTGQNVMVRFEGELLKIYLRRVFKTLGFRPS